MRGNEINAKDAKGQWVIIDDVPGEDPATCKVTAVTDSGRGYVRLTMKHPTLGTWRPEYRKVHILRLGRT